MVPRSTSTCTPYIEEMHTQQHQPFVQKMLHYLLSESPTAVLILGTFFQLTNTRTIKYVGKQTAVHVLSRLAALLIENA